jgi:hypothetical protein
MVQLGLNTQLTAGAPTSTTVRTWACAARDMSVNAAGALAIAMHMRILPSRLFSEQDCSFAQLYYRLQPIPG